MNADPPDTGNENANPVVAIAALGILMLLTRASVALLTSSWVLPEGWGFAYEVGEIAASLASGTGFSWPVWRDYPGQPTAWMPPVYPVVIAAAFKSFGIYSHKAAISLIALQTILSLLTGFFLYLIGKRLFNAKIGLLAAFIFALYPASIHFTVQKIGSTPLFACCVSLLVLLLMSSRERPTVTKGVWLGLLCGFTALVDPLILAAVPFMALWLYARSVRDHVVVPKLIGTAFIVFMLTLSPWLIRNYLTFGQYVFIKSNFGHELFLGNNPHATGRFSDKEWRRTFAPSETAFLRKADEPSRNAFFLRKGLDHIFSYPFEFLRLTVKRFLQYWSFMMRPVSGFEQGVSLLIYFVVLGLATIGLLLSRRKGPDVQLLWILLITLPLPYYFTVVGLFRYRFAVEMLLVLLAAFTVYRIACRLFPSYGMEVDRGSIYGAATEPKPYARSG